MLAVMAEAGMSQGMESVVESWVSVMEHHSSKLRNIGQDRLHNESVISINGPDTTHCDIIVKDGLSLFNSQYRRAGMESGHFIRKSENIKSFVVSQAIDHIVNQSSKKLQVMTE